MKKQTVSSLLLTGVSLLALILFVHHAIAGAVNPLPAVTDIYTSRTMGNGPSGLLNTSHTSIFGPRVCIDFGDPFSPWNSPWAPGPHTYHFRIRIPADYPSNILRVELFDPDSINQSINTNHITFTDYAINTNPGTFPPAGVDRTCPSADQRNPCLIDTGEMALVDPQGSPPVVIDQINPFWFMRVDENRGAGSPPGNGNCGSPSSYTPAFNTNTLYELYYYTQNANGTLATVNIAHYTGQTGDGVRDSGDHLTDLHWVSPGGTVLYDQPAPVPVDAGSPGDFELDLSQDIPGIITDPDTGDRYLYLDITALDGASENGFDIWAGPLITDTSSNVNVRNIQILNNPSIHDSQGVVVTALDYLPVNSNVNFATDIPLTPINAAQAGESVYISLYDSDSGSQPPVIFYFDTIAESDWSLTFGAGDPDPDGVSGRCQPGSCQTQWVEPPYNIQIPTLTTDCDLDNPDPQICTPFYGGKLMARYIGGEQDTYGWEVDAPDAPTQATTGCSAFPIAINELARSVTPPGTGTNPYPEAAEFDYPPIPPTYGQFLNHDPDILLSDAGTGYVFKVANGTEEGSFGWLVWNQIISPTSQTLAGSLGWPGDSLDYPDRGFYEAGDPADMTMHIGDWVGSSAGSITATEVISALNEHIDLGRVLRLPAWVVNNGGAGTGLWYQMDGFVLFRLHGYNLSEGWLLLEFLGWDTSCGQPDAPVPADLVVSAPELVSTTPITAYEPVDFRVTVTNLGDDDINDQFFVDIFPDPTEIYSTGIPIGQSSGYTAISSLAAHASETVTITVPTGLANEPLPHWIYAMVDSVEQIGEGEETNNVSQPLLVENVIPSAAYIDLQPNCGIGPDVQFSVLGFNWPMSETISLYWDGMLQSTINTGSSTSFSQMWTQLGQPDGVHEVSAISSGATAVANFTIPCPSPTEPLSVTISGPTQGITGASYQFTAVVSPETALTPITYTWQTMGTTPITTTSSLTDTISFAWEVTGTYTITVSASNALGGPVTATHTIEITAPPWSVYLPVMLQNDSGMVERVGKRP